MPTECHNTRSGFTLPEATLALVILGMAAAGVLLPFVGGVTVQAEGGHRTLAAKLANDLMEQIVSLPYEQIAALNGRTEAQGEVMDASGVAFADPIYARFSRVVSCGPVYLLPQSGAPLAPTFTLISVKVSWQDREMIKLTRLVSK